MPLKKHASLALASITLALLAGGLSGGVASGDQDNAPGPSHWQPGPGPARGFTATQVLTGS